ncbi:MAG: S8 family serine peptidase [Acidobacteria bacterium]|nr:S8 family serine peptidase [Acidobacteriota bacterium]
MNTRIPGTRPIFTMVLFGFWFYASLPASAQLQTPPAPPTPVANATDFIVTFVPGTSQTDRAAAVQRAGARLRFNYEIVTAVAITVPNANALAALQRDPSVLEIIPDRTVQAFQSDLGKGGGNGKPGGGGGTVTGQEVPDGVTRVGPAKPGSDGSGVGVAIIDTGLDLSHADLTLGGTLYDAFEGTCQDGNGHGTHVAGIVAAKDNNQDVIGVAPAATVYCVRVLNNSGSGSDSTVMAGLDWVYQNGASASPPIGVVNMSLGRSGTLDDNPALREAVQNLVNNDVVVVVAAGNDSSKEVKNMIPAGYPEVLAVASTTAVDGSNAGCRGYSATVRADTASYFTTDGKLDLNSMIGVTISAPGATREDISKACFLNSVGILSLKVGGGTTRMSGTSMAAPHVAGIAARLLQTGTLAGNVRSTLRSTADKPGTAPINSPASGYTYDGEREGVAQAP